MCEIPSQKYLPVHLESHTLVCNTSTEFTMFQALGALHICRYFKKLVENKIKNKFRGRFRDKHCGTADWRASRC